jgi:hypothetical protein
MFLESITVSEGYIHYKRTYQSLGCVGCGVKLLIVMLPRTGIHRLHGIGGHGEVTSTAKRRSKMTLNFGVTA